MCGISGLFALSGRGLADGDECIRRMNGALRHRGPDDHGAWNNARRNVFLGHQRLSIIDLTESGHQPMAGEGGEVIVFNGEIFSYRRLKANMPHFAFKTNSDTEVVLELYRERGAGCLEPMDGMFAFSIWDEKKEELFLARDRIGIKPLYYSLKNGIFAFSSEIKALLELPWMTAELDERALYHFLTFNKLAPPQTMFRDIYKFHPGYRMIVGRNGIRHYGKYWDVSYDNFDGQGFIELKERVLDGLIRAVDSWSVSDVPVGAFLSGGVDSSAVVALMSRKAPSPVQTFAVGFKDSPKYNELDYARKAADLFKTEHHERIVTAEDIMEFLPRIADIFDEPLADATSIPIYFISRMARDAGIKVVLTGDGGDELFCGYRKWVQLNKLDPYFRAYSKLPRPVKSAVAKMYGIVGGFSPNHEILVRAARNQELFWGGAGGFKESAKGRLLSRGFLKRMANEDSYGHVLSLRGAFSDIPKNGRNVSNVDWLCFYGVKDIIPNYYLHRTDRMGMANGVEIRVPFLDHHFVDLALSVPGKWKTRDSEPKYILKKSLESILPAEILYRRKQGFCVPLDEWMREYFIDAVDSQVDAFCDRTDIFDRDKMKKLIQGAKQNEKNGSFMLWNFYFLMAWMTRWMK